MRILIVILCALGAVSVGRLSAQDPVTRQPQQQQQRQPEPEDTIPVPPFRYRPPISPSGAMLRSMVLPGWGQAALGRRGAGGVFVFFEGLTLTMWVKSMHQQDYLERSGYDPADDRAEDDKLKSKEAEVEDWLVLLAFNHLLAGLEAYVAANLWDFPVDLEARVLAPGSVGLGIAVPLYLSDP